MSIASSVLKKKTPKPAGTSDGSELSDLISEGIEEGLSANVELEFKDQVEGLGIPISISNNDYHKQSNSTLCFGSLGSLTPASPSPPNRGSMLLTPANADVYHGQVNGGQVEGDEVGTGKGGLVDGQIRGSDQGSEDGSGYKPSREVEIVRENHQSSTNLREGKPSPTNDQVEVNGQEDYVPMFASLAHTPEQIAEMKRMRDEVVRRKSSGLMVAGIPGFGHLTGPWMKIKESSIDKRNAVFVVSGREALKTVLERYLMVIM
jgi:hypothetical protein